MTKIFWTTVLLLLFVAGCDSGNTTPPPLNNDALAITPLVAALEASRTDCISPCTVIFSAQNTSDTSSPDAHEVFKDLGYHFTFDDPTSGLHATTGLTQNAQIGGPMATHTFICKTGVCSYNVGVRAQNTNGDYDDEFVTVTVTSATTAYAGENTICVSSSGAYTGDEPCPDGAIQVNSLPAIGAYTEKRILLRRGDVFGDDLCIGYSEKNILIEPFGNSSDPRPELSGNLKIGVDSTCNDNRVNTAQATALGLKWAENITVSGLRLPNIRMGMSYYHVGLHDLDMDYYDASSGGYIQMTNSTNYCNISSDLDCSATPYPNGLYMSEVNLVGNNVDAVNYTGQSVIIAGYSCPMINWLGMVGTTFWNSGDNQFRLEGGQRLSFSHNKMRGHTKSGRKRSTLTLRSCGFSDVDVGAAIASGSGRHNVNQNTAGAPWTRWAVFADNIHGSADAPGLTFKLHIAPTNGNVDETDVDVIVERSTFVNGLSSSIDLSLNGTYLTARINNTYTPEMQDCKDIGPASNSMYGNVDCLGVVPPIPAAPGL